MVKILQEKLWSIAQKGSLDDLRLFMKQYSYYAWLPHWSSGDHVIHVLARCGRVSLVRTLVDEYNLPLNVSNHDGKVPLHEASAHGQPDMVQFLISRGVIINPLKRSGWTPLMMSCAKSNLNVVMKLVEAGANLHLQNKDGWTCFHIACRGGNLSILQYLYSVSFAIADSHSNNGRTPLHTAALHGRAEAVMFLFNTCKVNYDARDSCGNTPFLDAVRSGDLQTIQVFIDRDSACLKDRNRIGLGCLHVAAEANQADALLHLCSYSLDINAKVEVDGMCKGQTPLHFAFKENNKDTINALKSLNANENLKDEYERTPNELSVRWTTQ